tara:strand:+ start:11382 stop:12065 length:684 start_codon:yes stop_codon:yes gene_type:complete
MRIGIEINGVLRDTIDKFKQIYEKHLVDTQLNESTDRTYEIDFSGDTDEVVSLNENVGVNSFEYKILSDVTSLDLLNHFSFQNKEELYSFMYEEYTMELFGHAPSTEMTTFNILNDLYYELREEYDLSVVSDEIGRSKPSTLFFLSKFGCLIEKVFFYSESTKNTMWDSVDILLTANPTLLLEKPKDKIVVKFNTTYNKQIESDYEISSLSEFKNTLEKILTHVSNF